MHDSILELRWQVEQLVNGNPFLEIESDWALREEFGLPQSDTPVSETDRDAECALYSSVDQADSTCGETDDESLALSGNYDLSWDGDGTVEMLFDDGEWDVKAKCRHMTLEKGDDTETSELSHLHESLQSHLRRQALGFRLADEDKCALQFLIESLNEDGYLEEPLFDLVQSLVGEARCRPAQMAELLHHFTIALGLLQSLEPVGVGARDLGECLRLQLRALALQKSAVSSSATPCKAVLTLASRICAQPMHQLSLRDIKSLVERFGDTEPQTRMAIALIERLEPKPGRRFVDVDRNVEVPDVLVIHSFKSGSATKSQLQVKVNPDVMINLRMNDRYECYVKEICNRGCGTDFEILAYLEQRLQEARSLIEKTQQRVTTILNVSTAIVEWQEKFFIDGDLAMRPLVMREIADKLGLSESTVSRVTTANYIGTRFGVFKLKHFFGSGLGAGAGGSASSTTVRALIKQFIGGESVRKPLSDSMISEMLKEQNIDCARRTVAKYREELKIAPAALRKSHC